MLQSDPYAEGRGFHMEYRQLKCKNSTDPVPEALTLRKSPQEQTIKTALYISRHGDTANGTASSHSATGGVNATVTESPEKVGATQKTELIAPFA